MAQRRTLRPVLVNKAEVDIDRQLVEIAAENGDRLMPKVRVADVVELDQIDGLKSVEKTFGLKAHLDFVMVDAETSLPRFAVELDGRQHWTDPEARWRDRTTDSLLDRAELPLLRVTSEYGHGDGRWPVMRYAVEAFYRSEAFFQAQHDGIVPWDEPFDPGNFLTRDDDGQLIFDTLDAKAIRRLRQLYSTGKIPAAVPSHFCTELPDDGIVQAHAFLAVDHDRYLVGKARVRDFRFQGIAPSELAEQLAIAEIGRMAEMWTHDGSAPVAVNGRSLKKEIAEIQGAIDQGHLLTHGWSSNALTAGRTVSEGPVIRRPDTPH